MKSILLSIMLLLTLFSQTYGASEIGMSKQEMMRGTEIQETRVSEQSEAGDIDMQSDDMPSDSRSSLATIFATAIVVIIVGLLSTFISKLALSLRSGDDQ